ncbi:acyltransferase family protein [Lacisediminimonas profundi]|uniref:acyltransferase family protein n=1 Tax=Lacisediminimonas profundi TaxID=2603856 RepID=UPI00124B7B80|nr:acyltransferase [Lacisediminimonas profundi]
MIKSLEGGRGLAALIVALYHLKIGTAEWSVLRNGYLFVDLFFVLSGFVICAAYSSRMNDSDDFRSFFIRRTGRLLPLLWFTTLFFILVQNGIVLAKRIATFSGHDAFLRAPGTLDYFVPDPLQLLAVATFTHGMGLFEDLVINTPSWSISTEFFTYLLFAGVCLLFRGRTRVVMFALLAIAGLAISAWGAVTVHNCLAVGGCLSLTYDFGFPRTVFSFFLGTLCWHFSQIRNTGGTLFTVAGSLLLLALLMLVDGRPMLAFGFPFAFALLILGVSGDHGWLAGVLKTRPLQILGERSYSIYLMHMPLVMIFENLAHRTESPAFRGAVLLSFVATLLILSGWTYRFIEQPFRHMFNRLADRKALSASELAMAKD